MHYLGGKNRIARELCEFMLQRGDISHFVEPFCGALNISIALLRLNPSINITCSDKHRDLIEMWLAVKNGWQPPTSISRAQYTELKNHNPSVLRTFVGYGCSFSGKWFGGYASDNTGRNYCANAANSINKYRELIKRIEFIHGGYNEIHIPSDATVYCDPPYRNTTKPGARNPFDHDEFWAWVESLGNTCYVSEYESPNCREIWRKKVKTDMRTKQGKALRIEKLFCNKRG